MGLGTSSQASLNPNPKRVRDLPYPAFFVTSFHEDTTTKDDDDDEDEGDDSPTSDGRTKHDVYSKVYMATRARQHFTTEGWGSLIN